jgi:hypothetical protein
LLVSPASRAEVDGPVGDQHVEFSDAIPKTEATFRAQKVKQRFDPINPQTWDRDHAGIVLPRE